MRPPARMSSFSQSFASGLGTPLTKGIAGAPAIGSSLSCSGFLRVVPGSRCRLALDGFRVGAASLLTAGAAAVLSTAASAATCRVVLLLCHQGVCTAGKTRQVDKKHAACDEAGSSIKQQLQRSAKKTHAGESHCMDLFLSFFGLNLAPCALITLQYV
jgi:hypothetical protein